MYTKEFYATTTKYEIIITARKWMKLKISMLHKVSQNQKTVLSYT